MNISKDAATLIHIENDKLIINQEVLDILESIDSNVAIVSITGGPKVGKSSLLNWIENNNNFQINSKDSCISSEGIQICISDREVILPNQESCRIIYLDTEAILIDNDSEQSNILKLFTIIVLLSSSKWNQKFSRRK